jgi:hypothetical protein
MDLSALKAAQVTAMEDQLKKANKLNKTLQEKCLAQEKRIAEMNKLIQSLTKEGTDARSLHDEVHDAVEVPPVPVTGAVAAMEGNYEDPVYEDGEESVPLREKKPKKAVKAKQSKKSHTASIDAPVTVDEPSAAGSEMEKENEVSSQPPPSSSSSLGKRKSLEPMTVSTNSVSNVGGNDSEQSPPKRSKKEEVAKPQKRKLFNSTISFDVAAGATQTSSGSLFSSFVDNNAFKVPKLKK